MGVDRLMGYPSKVTVAGDVLTWAVGEFDRRAMELVATIGEYVFDQTTDTTSEITAIPGWQADGTFDITVSPGHGFSSTDRCAPMQDANKSDYTLGTTAFAAAVAADGDRMLWWSVKDIAEINGEWGLDGLVAGANQTKQISQIGMLRNQECSLEGGSFWYIMLGALVDVGQIIIYNLTISALTQVVQWRDNGALSGGLRVTRCRVRCTNAGGNGLYFRGGAANVSQADNNMVRSGGPGIINFSGAGKLFYNNTVVGGNQGIDNNNTASTWKNNLVLNSLLSTGTDMAAMANAITSKNVTSDTTSPDGAGFQNKTFEWAGCLKVNSNKLNIEDYRVVLGSTNTVDAGDNIAGVDYDIDGNPTGVGTTPIGCSSGVIAIDADVVLDSFDGGNYTAYNVNSILDSASGGVGGAVPGKATLPAAAEVWDGASDYGVFAALTTPTYEAALEAVVSQGTGQYGGDGTQFTPSFVCPTPSEPTGPTLVITDQETGDAATATVSNADALSTNKVYGKSPDDDNWTLLATVSVNGSEGFGGLSVAEWEFYVLSIANDTGQAIGADGIIVQQISDGSDISTNAVEDAIREYGETMIIEAATEVKQPDLSRKTTWSTRSTMFGWLQPTSSALRIKYEQRQLVVTNKILIAIEPSASEGDRVNIDSVYYLIRGVVNQSGVDVMWRLDVERVHGP